MLERGRRTTGLDERRRKSTDDEVLPELVLGRSDHELVELDGGFGDADLIVNDLRRV